MDLIIERLLDVSFRFPLLSRSFDEFYYFNKCDVFYVLPVLDIIDISRYYLSPVSIFAMFAMFFAIITVFDDFGVVTGFGAFYLMFWRNYFFSQPKPGLFAFGKPSSTKLPIPTQYLSTRSTETR